jgi:predicted molibdopterin-dependent oxidoreductase YjgC
VELRVDGATVIAPEGATVLDACDLAGRYVPRLCAYPGLGCCDEGERCGLCVVAVTEQENRSTVLACSTAVQSGMLVATDDPALQAERLERLAGILNRHPHICLTCPDRDGCTREECTFGLPVEARCCDEFGRCEFGRLVAYIDPRGEVPRRAVIAEREAIGEGRIRREPGLCLECGRCVHVCNTSPEAGSALRMEWVSKSNPTGEATGAGSGRHRAAVPKDSTLRASGCTFCGQCVMVCPAGAFTAPGERGARWLEAKRRKTDLRPAVVPPEAWLTLAAGALADVPARAGVFILADDAGKIVRIGGVADLSLGIAKALDEQTRANVTCFRYEEALLYTQRESELLARHVLLEGRLPPGNDLGDDLFSDELFADEL